MDGHVIKQSKFTYIILPQLLYFVIYFSACSNESKLEIIEPELFAKVYIEMVLVSLDSTEGDSLQNLNLALDKYNVTRDKFEATSTYFESRPEIWLEVFTKIEEELKEIEAGDQKEELKTERKEK